MHSANLHSVYGRRKSTAGPAVENLTQKISPPKLKIGTGACGKPKEREIPKYVQLNRKRSKNGLRLPIIIVYRKSNELRRLLATT